MTTCLETDMLVSLGVALDWQTDGVLAHLAECPSCRDQLRRLATLHESLAQEVEPRLGFAEDVVARVRSASAAPTSPPAWIRVVRVLNPLLAAVTTVFAVLFVSGGAAPVDVGPVIGASVSAAAATYWWNRMRTPTSSTSSWP